MNEHSTALPIAPPAARVAAPPGRLAGAVLWVERQAPRLLLAGMALYLVIFFAASVYKYQHYGQGYDQVDYEQAIWNTVHGRPFEDLRFTFADTIWGAIDWMPLLAVFVPLYALLPSPIPLFFVQILAVAVGAWPVYQLAKTKLGRPLPALAFGLAWLLYPTVEYADLDPFQMRIFSTVLLLFALLYFEQERMAPFVLSAGLALLCREDSALVLMMFAVFALAARKGWRWVLVPGALGAGYFVLVMVFVVPAFVHVAAGPCTGPVPMSQIANAWPGVGNPNLGYYLHWGCTPGMILGNLLKDPLYTFNYMFGDVHKLEYLGAMLAPFAFLSLLAPARLLFALPILGLNLIAWRPIQTDYRSHYQLLITVGIVASAVAGYQVLERLLARRAGGATPGPVRAALPAVALLGVALAANVGLHNPVLRTALYHETDARVAAANRLVAMVPADAPVAASSFLAPHLLPRRYLYNFPPGPNSPYSMSDFKDLQYILVDPDASAIEFNKLPDGRTALQALEQSPQWTLLASDQDFRLYQRARP